MLLRDSVGGGQPSLFLEEVELTEDQPTRWKVTFSYSAMYPENPVQQRYYKTVDVLAETGEVRAVKIRVLD